MWKKIKEKGFIGLFLLMIFGLPLLYRIVGPETEENSENRTLAEKPKFSLAGYREYPERYEQYFNDHVAFKPQLVKLNQMINYRLFGMAENDQCVLGKEGWLFCKVDQTIEDYQGMCVYGEEQLAAIAGELVRVQEYYQSKGIRFILFIAPNKESVYGELLPDKYEQIRDHSKADQLVGYLAEHTDLFVVYPKTLLRERKDRYPLYYKYDTHWTDVGAYLSVNELIGQMGYATMPDADQVTFQEEGEHVGDLAVMLGLLQYFHTEPEIGVADFTGTEAETVYSYPHHILFNEKFTADGANPEKVYVVGDSFSAKLAEYLKYSFSETTVIHRMEYTPGLAEGEETDIVVCEVVERYMDEMGSISEVLIPKAEEME